MSKDGITASQASSTPVPASFVETWANQGELNELDQLLNRYVELGAHLCDANSDAVIESHLTKVISAGLMSFRLLRSINLRWRDEVNSGRVPLEWGNMRAISDRYSRWFAVSRLVLEENRRFSNGPDAAVRRTDARLLHDACLEAMVPANINVDDLKASYERVDSYNKAWDKRPAVTGGSE